MKTIKTIVPSLLLGLFAACLIPTTAKAVLVLESSFNPSNANALCGIGFDRSTSGVWIQECSQGEIQRYSTSGVFQTSIPSPGEPANDIDIEFSSSSFTLGSTALSSNTLLVINGERAEAEIYAVDKVSGLIIETLATSFGNSHVVGGAYHPIRDSFFLVQDQFGVPSENTITEVDPGTGAILNSFSTGFTVNFGDLEVGANGNLFVASNVLSTISEFSPIGALIQELALPSGVTAISGLAMDEGSGEVWASSTDGIVYQIRGLQKSQVAVPEPSALAMFVFGLLGLGFLSRYKRAA